MDFAAMTDEEIREYAAKKIEAATGHPFSWFVNSAALSPGYDRTKVGMLRHANYGRVDFEPLAEIEQAAGDRLAQAQSCFRW